MMIVRLSLALQTFEIMFNEGLKHNGTNLEASLCGEGVHLRGLDGKCMDTPHDERACGYPIVVMIADRLT